MGGVGLAWLGLFAPADEFLILVPGLLAWGASLQFFFSGPEAGVMAAVPRREQGQAAVDRLLLSFGHGRSAPP